MRFLLAVTTALVFCTACGHVTAVRPVPKGTVEVEGALGGPIAHVSDTLTLPLPLTTLGARWGVADRFDVAAHVHLTSLVFSVAGLDAGGSYLVLEQRGFIPALSASASLYGFTDLAFRGGPRAYLDLTAAASWLYADRFITYVSGTGFVQFAGGPVLPTVAVGEQVQLGQWGLQLEARWYEPGIDSQFMVVDWYGIGGHGAWGALLSVSYRFGGAR